MKLDYFWLSCALASESHSQLYAQQSLERYSCRAGGEGLTFRLPDVIYPLRLEEMESMKLSLSG
jgi:hypothetical protein